MKLFYRITQTFFSLYFKLFYRHKVYGTELIPEGAALIASNHSSYFDPPIIAASLPEEGYYLARSSLFKNFILRTLITNLNAYPVAGSPQDLNSFKVIYKLLKEEKKVVIFPEGYRTFDGSFGEIKTGVAMLAIKANCPVIPVYIHGAYEAWPRQKKFFNLFGHTACVFGHPLYPSNTTPNSKKQEQEILTRRLQESLYKLKTWYLSGAPGFPPS